MGAGGRSAGIGEQRGEGKTEGAQRDDKPEREASITGSLWRQKGGTEERWLC